MCFLPFVFCSQNAILRRHMLELTQSFMIPLVRLQNSLKWPLENTPHVGQIQIADSDLPLPPLRMCFNRSLQAPPLPHYPFCILSDAYFFICTINQIKNKEQTETLRCKLVFERAVRFGPIATELVKASMNLSHKNERQWFLNLNETSQVYKTCKLLCFIYIS